MSDRAAFPPDFGRAYREELTDAERKVARLLARGYSAGEIADDTCRSVSTVRTHIRNVGQKLPGPGRAQVKAVRAFATTVGAST